MWMDDPARWPLLAAALEKAGEFGLDTETFGQPDKTSPQHRARIHCWSIGLLTEGRHPRGYHIGVGRVLPRAALDCPAIRAVLRNPHIIKWAHNSPHDHHSLLNEGIEVANMQDSLQYARVAAPGMRAYGLKDMEQWALGYPARPSFKDMVSYDKEAVVVRASTERGCVCGDKPCRARATTDFLDDLGNWRPHTRVTWRRFHPEPKLVPGKYDVADFAPGHPRWAEWVQYSLMDAVRGIELVDWIRNRKPSTLPYQWRPL